MRILWGLFLRLKGWRVSGSFPKDLQKAVVIVGPHTSSWDFVIGLAIRSTLHLEHIKYLGKAELFKPPLGFFFRKMGGIPVKRTEQHHLVAQVVEQFNNNENFILALSPEGTRKKVTRLKTGFYHIAQKTGVPIIMAGIDFNRKLILFGEPFFTTGNQAADFEHIHHFFAPIKGKHPENGMSDLLNQQNTR